MRYRVFEDPFFHQQPTASFVEDLLRPVHAEAPLRWNTRVATEREIFLTSLCLALSFPDTEGLLETAYEDFRSFMRVSRIAESEQGIRLATSFAPTACKEAYRITVNEQEILLEAADTEGIRRGLIYLEDEMKRREGAFLPLGVIERHPFIKTRISRCFFSPPSHASSEGTVNELASEIDYYPEAYLNRLAHDGINALWIGASFHDLLKSDVIPECGADSERRLAKLGQIVKKCRCYGIGIYLFSIEPASGHANRALENHLELTGSFGRYNDGTHLFCPSTDGCREYIRGAIRRLFEAVPDLAGYLNISTGEWLSGCGSYLNLTCPRCKEKYGSHGATLAATEKLIMDAMKEFAPHAEFISWTYNQRAFDRNVVKEACELRDPSVIHMQNFEDYGRPVQLGRKRLSIDYWLSFTGPGEIMVDSLAINRRRGVRTFAKIQACSSHEISTVPYVPVPGILYDKYRFMRENGIDGVVQCWYFGNYPCMMNKAASELAFEPFFPERMDFLRHLAGIYWGSDAQTVAEAWDRFEKGYRNFPVSVSFEWFGPMQDSPAVPLRLKPVDLPMPSTWLACDPVGGDRIGECLTNGHTMEEAVELTTRMCEGWNEGIGLFSAVSDCGEEGKKEQKSVAEAIAIIFGSGRNVLRFYQLRHKLGLGKEDPSKLLAQMEQIVREEIEHSRALIPLCEKDSRLGYHSEAHGYKFFKEKLLWRIEELERCLATEFPEIQGRIEQGLPPLEFYLGTENGARVVPISECGTPVPFVTKNGEAPMTTVSATESKGRITVTFRMKDGASDLLMVRPEFHLFHPTIPFVLNQGRLSMNGNAKDSTIKYSFVGEYADEVRSFIECQYRKEGDESIYEISFCREKFGMEEGEPFRWAVKREGRHEEQLAPDDRVYERLIQEKYSPDAYAFFIGK